MSSQYRLNCSRQTVEASKYSQLLAQELRNSMKLNETSINYIGYGRDTGVFQRSVKPSGMQSQMAGIHRCSTREFRS